MTTTKTDPPPGNTLTPMPRQNRPKLEVVKTFRLTKEDGAAVDAKCERDQVNLSDIVREFVIEWAKGEDA